MRKSKKITAKVLESKRITLQKLVSVGSWEKYGYLLCELSGEIENNSPTILHDWRHINKIHTRAFLTSEN